MKELNNANNASYEKDYNRIMTEHFFIFLRCVKACRSRPSNKCKGFDFGKNVKVNFQSLQILWKIESHEDRRCEGPVLLLRRLINKAMCIRMFVFSKET